MDQESLNARDFATIEDDLSNRFSTVSGKLCNSTGAAYPEFRRTLTPRYAVVWAQIALGYVVIATGVVALHFVQPYALYVRILATLAAGCLFGYAIAYVGLYMHEASHYNLHPDRKWNDRLANAFIGVLTGTDIRAYRPVHFDHHRNLGLPEDPEFFYFLPLGVRLFLESAFGITLLKAIVKRRKNRDPGRYADASGGRLVTLCGAALHGALLGAAIFTGHYEMAAAWIFGIAAVWPFFSVLRPILEHRSEEADAAIDYRNQPHGAVTRIFGDNPFDATLGGAGFNRHLLHHWEPQVSCTRLRDLEKFLLDTEIAPILKRRRTSYVRIFFQLFRR